MAGAPDGWQHTGGQAEFWDERYGRPGFLFGTEPNDFLRAVIPAAAPGATAFCPADGEGRNGVWMAKQGYAVSTIDVSEKAVAKARTLAAQQGVALDIRVGDIFAYQPDTAGFDVVAVSFMHFQPAMLARFHALLVSVLKPGGLLALEGYQVDQLPLASGGPKDPAMLFTRETIAPHFAGLDILLLQDCRRTLSEGERHRGEAATVQLLARKPR